MKKVFPKVLIVMAIALASCQSKDLPIDRKALVDRNDPVITTFDKYSSLSVGNGEFAFTVDATGLQSFPSKYTDGVPLGTQSQWGWHSFDNVENYKFEETLKDYDFGRGRQEPYSVQFNEDGRQKQAANWFRENPHRLHLGMLGFDMTDRLGNKVDSEAIAGIEQKLDLWNGIINSKFSFDGMNVSVETVCHPTRDRVSVSAASEAFKSGNLKIDLRFPYPTAKHVDDACRWDMQENHQSAIIDSSANGVVIEHKLDQTTYYVVVTWNGNAFVSEKEPHVFEFTSSDDTVSLSCEFLENKPTSISADLFAETKQVVGNYWNSFWSEGGVVDFSQCTDPRAAELERRVVLSQYLMAIQCSGSRPPQETGLTYNSWYGKFHLEMHWWHAVHFALWGRPELLERSMDWYKTAEPVARSIAERQGFDGIRWMKMTDPSAIEAPSKVGSFLIWQQPHYIYMVELLYRSNPSVEIIDKYKDLVFETADFMADFATFDSLNNRYVLKGIIPAQETLRASETVNPPFELSYWHYALGVAQQWRERAGLEPNEKWQSVIDGISPLASLDGLYLAAETAPETYSDVRFTSDHMAVLGACGILPHCDLFEDSIMKNTLAWIWDNWNWDKTWGWDYPMTAMNAARLGEPEKAVSALLMDKRTNTYLPNGHNYQDDRLRVYLPGNGGLLTTVAMMCAGWDGSEGKNPGFPDDGTWNVKWEGLVPMP